MKKIGNIILVLWCAITSFISPLWLTLIYLNITGLIYQYDYSMDEETAGIFGVVGAVLWCVLVLIPDVIFLKKLKEESLKKMIGFLVLMIMLSMICVGMFGWNLIAFWTT